MLTSSLRLNIDQVWAWGHSDTCRNRSRNSGFVAQPPRPVLPASLENTFERLFLSYLINLSYLVDIYWLATTV